MLAGEGTWQEEVAVKWKDPLPSFYDRFSVRPADSKARKSFHLYASVGGVCNSGSNQRFMLETPIESAGCSSVK